MLVAKIFSTYDFYFHRYIKNDLCIFLCVVCVTNQEQKTMIAIILYILIVINIVCYSFLTQCNLLCIKSASYR